MVVFGVVALLWILISSVVGEGCILIFTKLLKVVSEPQQGIFQEIVDRLSCTGRFEVNAERIMGIVENG